MYLTWDEQANGPIAIKFYSGDYPREDSGTALEQETILWTARHACPANPLWASERVLTLATTHHRLYPITTPSYHYT